MAFSSIPNVLDPTYAIGLGLTPERSNYLDTYDFTTADHPDLRQAAIEKYDNTLTGFVSKYATSEELKADKYIWSELETKAITYEDAILTVASGVVTLTRATSGEVHYRKHEKIQVQTSEATTGAGIFIVTSVDSATQVTLGTYDANAVALEAVGNASYTASITWSLGMEVGKGSLESDFTTGITRNYSILSNRPTITRDVYTELGSVVLNLKWASIDGQYYWYLPEIDDTRDRFFESVEKKHIEGTIPDASSDATTAGLQGTQGLFAAIEDRGATWGGNVTSIGDLEDLIKYYDKVQGAGVNMFMCSRQQSLDFDTLGRTFNADYGGSAVLENYIGAYTNSMENKVLNLGFQGFKHGGYLFLKQDWKYLRDHTFRGYAATGANTVDDIRVNFLTVPIGMTPVSDGDQNLAYNNVVTQRSYLTKMYAKGRDYATQVTGGFNTLSGANTTADDKFGVHFLNESFLAAFNAEKFIIGKGA